MYEEANRLGCSVLSQFLFWYGDSDGVFVVVVIIVGCLVLLLSSSPLLTSCTHLPATQPDSSKVVCWLHCFVLLAFLSSFSNIPCWCCCCCFWSGLFSTSILMLSAQRRSRITHMHFNHFGFRGGKKRMMATIDELSMWQCLLRGI